MKLVVTFDRLAKGDIMPGSATFTVGGYSIPVKSWRMEMDNNGQGFLHLFISVNDADIAFETNETPWPLEPLADIEEDDF